MALVISITDVCGGGNHATLTAEFNSVKRAEVVYLVDELMAAPTDKEIEITMRVLVKLYSIGKTKAQTRNGLEAGWTINT